MKKKFLRIFLIILTVFLASHCGEPTLISLKVSEVQREFTTGYKDPVLGKYMESLSAQASSGRVASTIYDRINWNKSYKIFDPAENRTAYTLPLIIEVPNQFDNLILVNNDGNEENYIVRYKPTSEWLAQKPRRGGSETFTGTIEIVELNGVVRVSTNFENGEAISSNDSPNGRTSTCQTWIDVVWTEVCVDGNCTISEITVTEYDVCDDNTGGGGSSGSGGDTDSEGTSGGGGTPIGGGSSGSVDPVDISYYLIPLKKGDDLSNPYDGMQARDANGVIYTYNASLNAWLMPDLVVLSENGYVMQFDDGQLINDFDGQILSTVTAIALVEPTFVGEIIVGGIILYIIVYEANQIETAHFDHIEMCQEKWLNCSYSQPKCYDCYRFCEPQGFWPTYSHMCP